MDTKGQNRRLFTSTLREHWIHFLLLLVCVGGMGIVRYLVRDDRIRRVAIETLEQMTGAVVEAESVKLTLFSHVRIKGLRLYGPKGPTSPEKPILQVDDLLVRHRPLALLRGRFEVKQLVFSGATLNIQYDLDTKKSNLDGLKLTHKPGPSSRLPDIIIRKAWVQFREISNGLVTGVGEQVFSARFTPSDQDNEKYEFDLQTSDRGILKHAKILGRFHPAMAEPIEVTATFRLERIDVPDFPQRRFFGLDSIGWYNRVEPVGEITLKGTMDRNNEYKLQASLQNGRMRIWDPNTALHLLDLNSELEFTRKGLIIKTLKGKVENHFSFYAHGAIKGFNKNADYELTVGSEGFEIPSGQWQTDKIAPGPNDKIVKQKSEFLVQVHDKLPEWLRNILESLSLTGRMDMEMRIRNRPGSHKIPWVRGKVVFHHANILYDRFPYPVQGIGGNIIFDPNEVIVGPLVCKQAGADIVYEDHRQRQADRQYSYNIRINVQNATVDETLYHALPQEYHRWWDTFDPRGRVDVFFHASQDAQGKRDQGLEVKLLDVDAVYKNFAVPLKNIQGQMTITRDQTTLKVDRAEAASGQVSLEGTLTRTPSGASVLSGKGSFQNVLMNKTLIENLPNPLQLHCRQLGLDGRIDGAARIRSLLDPNENAQSPVVYHVKAALRNGRLKYKFFPYELVDVQAKVNLTNDRVDVESLIARNASARIQINGTIKSNQNFRLHVVAEKLELNDALREAVADHLDGLWEKLNPKGQIDARLDIARKSEQSPVILTGVIEPKRSEVRFKDFDYPLRNIVGTIKLEPGRIILDELTSTNGPSKITVSGTMGRDEKKQNEFDIQAGSIPLDDKLARVLPDGFKAFKDHIGLSGTLDGRLHVSYRPTDNETDKWEYQAQVTMTKGQVTQPVVCTDMRGLLVGEGEYNSRSKALTISADLKDVSMLIEKRPMENLKARIEYGDPNNLLTLRDISGRFCDGQLSGQAGILLAKEGAGYQFQLTTRNVDFAELLEAGKKPAERRKNLKGRLGGWINVQQDISKGPRRGMFQFFVTDAVMGELPILAQLLHLINFSWPKEGAFNEITIRGSIADETTRFDSIFLRGSAISLNGVGQMKGADNQLHLIFLVGGPYQIPPIPGITDLVTMIQPALSHLRVTGTFDKPKVESVAFSTFEKTLKYFQGENQP